jgi:hypothetical protein
VSDCLRITVTIFVSLSTVALFGAMVFWVIGFIDDFRKK